jgi:hypothetical protein
LPPGFSSGGCTEIQRAELLLLRIRLPEKPHQRKIRAVGQWLQRMFRLLLGEKDSE